MAQSEPVQDSSAQQQALDPGTESQLSATRIAKLLLDYNVISEVQLRDVLAQKQKNQARSGELIVKMGFATEAEIIDIINRHYRIKATSLDDDIDGMVEARRRGLRQLLSRIRVPIKVKLSFSIIFLIVITVLVLSYVVLTRQASQLYDATVDVVIQGGGFNPVVPVAGLQRDLRGAVA